MSANATTSEPQTTRDARYVAAIEKSLNEMAERRKEMKETDREIRQIRADNRRILKEIWATLRRVEATL
jgi:hypothetical protein